MDEIIPSPIIKYNTTINDNIASAINIISLITKNNNQKVILDLREVEYASPFFVLPLESYILHTSKEIEFWLSNSLHNILFPLGMNTEGLRPLVLNSKLNKFVNKDYLPIIIFPADTLKEDNSSSVLSMIEKILYTQLESKKNVISCLKYVIGEITGNITEHSRSSEALFFSIINKEENFIEIGIADFGEGLFGSYVNNNDKDISDEFEAIKAATRGISTKNLPNAENRGFGIRTCGNMIINGLKGSYNMISGHAMYINSIPLKEYYEFSPGIFFKGTLVIFNIPLTENKHFNYINYLE